MATGLLCVLSRDKKTKQTEQKSLKLLYSRKVQGLLNMDNFNFGSGLWTPSSVSLSIAQFLHLEMGKIILSFPDTVSIKGNSLHMYT